MMKTITALIEQMADEIDDAESYIDGALACYDHDKALADIYKMLASAEVEHFERLHEQAKKEMSLYKEKVALEGESAEAYHAAEIIYNYEQDRMLKSIGAVRVKISMY